jgi:hypothetical protein
MEVVQSLPSRLAISSSRSNLDDQGASAKLLLIYPPLDPIKLIYYKLKIVGRLRSAINQIDNLFSLKSLLNNPKFLISQTLYELTALKNFLDSLSYKTINWLRFYAYGEFQFILRIETNGSKRDLDCYLRFIDYRKRLIIIRSLKLKKTPVWKTINNEPVLGKPKIEYDDNLLHYKLAFKLPRSLRLAIVAHSVAFCDKDLSSVDTCEWNVYLRHVLWE